MNTSRDGYIPEVQDNEPGAEPEVEPEVIAWGEPGAESKVNTGAGPGADVGGGAESEVNARAEPGVEPEVGAGAEPGVDVRAGAEPEVGAGAEPAVNARAKPGVEPEVWAGAEPAVNARAKSGAESEVGAGAEPAFNAGAGSGVEPDVEGGAEPAVNADAGHRAGPGAESKVNTGAGPGADVGARAESEVNAGAGPGADVRGGAQLDVEGETEPDVNARANPGAGPDVDGIEPEFEVGVKPGAEPEVNAIALPRTDASSEPEPEPGADAGARAEPGNEVKGGGAPSADIRVNRRAEIGAEERESDLGRKPAGAVPGAGTVESKPKVDVEAVTESKLGANVGVEQGADFELETKSKPGADLKAEPESKPGVVIRAGQESKLVKGSESIGSAEKTEPGSDDEGVNPGIPYIRVVDDIGRIVSQGPREFYTSSAYKQLMKHTTFAPWKLNKSHSSLPDNGNWLLYENDWVGFEITFLCFYARSHLHKRRLLLIQIWSSIITIASLRHILLPTTTAY